MFIMVIDRLCKHMVTYALICSNLQNDHRINAYPVKAFADDIALSARRGNILQEMLRVGEPIMGRACLEVKDVKCAVLYGFRSGNN